MAIYVGNKRYALYVGNTRRKVMNIGLLPDGYVAVDGIMNSTNAYLNTGINGLNTISFDITMSLNESIPNNFECFFGMWPTASTGNGMQLLLRSNQLYRAEGRNKFSVSGISTMTNLTVGEKYSFTVTQTEPTSVDNPFYVFARNYGGNANTETDKVWIFALKIYQGGEIVRDYIPCISPNQIVGMYDLVSKSFFSSPNNSAFVAGNTL